MNGAGPWIRGPKCLKTPVLSSAGHEEAWPVPPRGQLLPPPKEGGPSFDEGVPPSYGRSNLDTNQTSDFRFGLETRKHRGAYCPPAHGGQGLAAAAGPRGAPLFGFGNRVAGWPSVGALRVGGGRCSRVTKPRHFLDHLLAQTPTQISVQAKHGLDFLQNPTPAHPQRPGNPLVTELHGAPGGPGAGVLGCKTSRLTQQPIRMVPG